MSIKLEVVVDTSFELFDDEETIGGSLVNPLRSGGIVKQRDESMG